MGILLRFPPYQSLSPLLFLMHGYLVFSTKTIFSHEEAADNVVFASAAAFSFASSAWSFVAPAANVASLDLRPNAATMLACTTSGGSVPS